MNQSNNPYVTEFRNRHKAQQLVQQICAEVQPGRRYRFMEFCGGHTHVLARWGL